MAVHTYFASTFYQGPWLNASGYGKGVKNRYLGLKFLINGQAHYGWARLNLKLEGNAGKKITTILTGYAYETIANKAIITGKTKGPDAITLQPATLGHLAAGASGIPSTSRRTSQ